MRLNELDAISKQLRGFIEEFVECFPRCDQRHWCLLYLTGLLLDGERKSIQPMAERVQGGNMQAMQQFIADSPWSFQLLSTQLYRLMVRRLKLSEPCVVIDDTTLPKKGKASVGVARQYCGALGKVANCQDLVTLQGVGEHGHIPMAARLYLPREWTDNAGRLDQARVPQDQRRFREKWRIALELLDETSEICSPGVVLADAAYGSNRQFRTELDQRGLEFVVQLRGDEKFWDGSLAVVHVPSIRKVGRPRQYDHVADKRRRPKSVDAWARELFTRGPVRHVRLKLQKPISIDFVATRIYEIVRNPRQRAGAARWLVIERLPGGEFKYYLSNLPPKTSPAKIIELAHQRWKVEQGYQQLKEELGLDHYEGRFWQGFHHHVFMCMMAYDFLQLLAHRQGRRKKNLPIASQRTAPNQSARPIDGLPPLRKNIPMVPSAGS